MFLDQLQESENITFKTKNRETRAGWTHDRDGQLPQATGQDPQNYLPTLEMRGDTDTVWQHYKTIPETQLEIKLKSLPAIIEEMNTQRAQKEEMYCIHETGERFW